ncbi:50S rRNA methyltransferase [bacterium]|nr:50S rRNA methyltransferase [bacterium]
MPQLILTADPDFLELALDDAYKAATEVTQVAQLAPGIMLLDCDLGFWGVAESWRQEPPIFARHIHPVDMTVPLRGAADDVSIIVDAAEAEIASMLDPDLPFSVQTRILGDLPYKPFDVNRALSQRLQELSGAPLDVRKPMQIVSVVCGEMDDAVENSGRRTTPLRTADDGSADDTQSAIRNSQLAFLGLSLADYNLSDWAGGERRFAREKDQVSRAEFKLLEALEVFHIDLPQRGVALDLGAAPGGWTRVLRQRDQYVTAVDPAELDPRLATDKAIRHKRVTAEAYLADEPDEFDLIVNDMRMDARDSARLMVDYARQLYPHGVAIMTFKLPEHGRRQVLEHAFKILRGTYVLAGARQLFHNRSEITVYLKKK